MFLRMRSMMEYDPEEIVMKAYNAWNVQNSSSSHSHSYLNTHAHTQSNPHSHPHTRSNSHSPPHTRHRREGLSAELSSGGFEVVIPLPTRGASASGSRGNSASEGRWAEGVIGSVGDKGWPGRSVDREGY
jgi:hypothetical protein